MFAAALFLLMSATPFADLAIGKEVVPPDLKLTGAPVAAARWTDRLGLNVVVVTETKRVGQASGGTKRLFGHHFVRDGGRWKPLWQIKDAVTDCEFDLTLEVVPGSLTVTDLDGDGTAESAFAYTGTCTSDVSPSVLKVLLHEGRKKYALRGSTRVQVGEADGKPEYLGGERTPDRAFTKAPPAFLVHAQGLFDRAGGK